MSKKKNMYFIGIGGIGMSALARYFFTNGHQVSGFDQTRTPLCEALEKEGMSIHYKENAHQIPKDFWDKKDTIVIYTPAIHPEHAELTFFREGDFEIYKRAQVLRQIAQNYTCLAIAGTHGKTTTSALLAHLFHHAGIKATAFLGGIAIGYQTNFLAGQEGGLLIAEADEFDRSFLQLEPEGAILISMDADHLDVYGDSSALENAFGQFAQNVKSKLIVKQGLPIKGMSYGIETTADYAALNTEIIKGAYYFDLKTPIVTVENIKTGLPGRHNVENAVATAALAIEFGLKEEMVKKGIESFKGVKRRFEYHIKTDKLVFIDDYAHHPSEITALINSVRELYPKKKITGIFQPHLYTRTRDFADSFAQSLSLLDELILMDIYPAREKPIPRISSSILLEKIDLDKKHIMGSREILSYVKRNKIELILTIGAGDIDQLVNPLKMTLLNG